MFILELSIAKSRLQYKQKPKLSFRLFLSYIILNRFCLCDIHKSLNKQLNSVKKDQHLSFLILPACEFVISVYLQRLYSFRAERESTLLLLDFSNYLQGTIVLLSKSAKTTVFFLLRYYNILWLYMDMIRLSFFYGT